MPKTVRLILILIAILAGLLYAALEVYLFFYRRWRDKWNNEQ